MIREVLRAIVMMCELVIPSEQQNCKAYVPDCFYMASFQTKDLKEIEKQCQESVAKIYMTTHEDNEELND